jgi:2-aminoethylphosphonate-pyruvate transaminase
MNSSGQFRYTPPTHVLRASSESIDEFNEEGGITARFNKYNTNQKYFFSLKKFRLLS